MRGSAAIRNAARLRDRDLCCNCGRHGDHTHHIVPLGSGGRDVLSNVVTICSDCHGLAHGTNFGDHKQLIRAGLAKAKAQGKPLGAQLPAVASANAQRAQEAQEAAERMAATIRPMREAGKTLQEIAEALETSSVPTVSGRGKWTATGVRRVLERTQPPA